MAASPPDDVQRGSADMWMWLAHTHMIDESGPEDSEEGEGPEQHPPLPANQANQADSKSSSSPASSPATTPTTSPTRRRGRATYIGDAPGVPEASSSRSSSTSRSSSSSPTRPSGLSRSLNAHNAARSRGAASAAVPAGGPAPASDQSSPLDTPAAAVAAAVREIAAALAGDPSSSTSPVPSPSARSAQAEDSSEGGGPEGAGVDSPTTPRAHSTSNTPHRQESPPPPAIELDLGGGNSDLASSFNSANDGDDGLSAAGSAAAFCSPSRPSASATSYCLRSPTGDSSSGGSGRRGPEIVRMVGSQTFFSAIVLAVWDNVMGPMTRQVWMGEDARLGETFYERLLPFVAKCTLNGEISRENVGQVEAEHKFYVLTELGFMMSTFVFTNADESGSTLYSLSLVLPVTQLSTYLSLHRLCMERLRSLIRRLQALLRREESVSMALTSFTDWLQPFLVNISSLGIESVSAVIDMSRTIFGPGNETMFDVGFIRKAITSHLQTGGVTVVMGKDYTQVNLMISSLALLLTKDERRLSRYAQPLARMAYAPDLILQGLIKRDDDDCPVKAEEIMQSQYPSTIIDLHGEGGTVTQTKRHNEYHVIRIESERDVLSQLQAGRHQRNPEHSEELFHEVDDSSELVQEALQEVFRPHRSAVRQALLSQFFRMIYRKALILVQYADAKGASPQNPLPDDVVSRIRKDLGLTVESDFEIVLAFAEKMRLGMFFTLLGDPAEKEKQLLGILGGF